MNGIEFMLRNLAGWTPPVPLPRRHVSSAAPIGEPPTPEEIKFIRNARGKLSSIDLAVCYGVSPETIRRIWMRNAQGQ